MYANVCALSLFLTCGPYARLPAWAGENSPECLILLNKRHEDACQVLHGPCQSLVLFLCWFYFLFTGLALIQWSEVKCRCLCSFLSFLLFSRLFWLPAVTDDTAPSAQTEGRSVAQHEPNAPRPPPPARYRQHKHTHTATTSHIRNTTPAQTANTNTQRWGCIQSHIEAKNWHEKQVKRKEWREKSPDFSSLSTCSSVFYKTHLPLCFGLSSFNLNE